MGNIDDTIKVLFVVLAALQSCYRVIEDRPGLKQNVDEFSVWKTEEPWRGQDSDYLNLLTEISRRRFYSYPDIPSILEEFKAVQKWGSENRTIEFNNPTKQKPINVYEGFPNLKQTFENKEAIPSDTDQRLQNTDQVPRRVTGVLRFDDSDDDMYGDQDLNEDSNEPEDHPNQTSTGMTNYGTSSMEDCLSNNPTARAHHTKISASPKSSGVKRCTIL